MRFMQYKKQVSIYPSPKFIFNSIKTSFTHDDNKVDNAVHEVLSAMAALNYLGGAGIISDC